MSLNFLFIIALTATAFCHANASTFVKNQSVFCGQYQGYVESLGNSVIGLRVTREFYIGPTHESEVRNNSITVEASRCSREIALPADVKAYSGFLELSSYQPIDVRPFRILPNQIHLCYYSRRVEVKQAFVGQDGFLSNVVAVVTNRKHRPSWRQPSREVPVNDIVVYSGFDIAQDCSPRVAQTSDGYRAGDEVLCSLNGETALTRVSINEVFANGAAIVMVHGQGRLPQILEGLSGCRKTVN